MELAQVAAVEDSQNLKVYATALLLLLLIGCQKHRAASFDYMANLGIAVEKSDRNCLDIRNGSLRPGQKIVLVAASTPETTSDAEIVKKVDQACTAPDQNSPGVQHYEFRLVRGSVQKAVPAFALANFGGPITIGESGAVADLDGDGHLESFRACTSSEGVHLTVWSGTPLTGARRWHYYYYLGYDVDPTCAESETKPDSP